MFSFKKPVPKTDAGVEYHVKVENLDAGEYNLLFKSRQDARDYKKGLKRSTRGLKAHILRREYDGNFISSEKEVF